MKYLLLHIIICSILAKVAADLNVTTPTDTSSSAEDQTPVLDSHSSGDIKASQNCTETFTYFPSLNHKRFIRRRKLIETLVHSTGGFRRRVSGTKCTNQIHPIHQNNTQAGRSINLKSASKSVKKCIKKHNITYPKPLYIVSILRSKRLPLKLDREFNPYKKLTKLPPRLEVAVADSEDCEETLDNSQEQTTEYEFVTRILYESNNFTRVEDELNSDKQHNTTVSPKNSNVSSINAIISQSAEDQAVGASDNSQTTENIIRFSLQSLLPSSSPNKSNLIENIANTSSDIQNQFLSTSTQEQTTEILNYSKETPIFFTSEPLFKSSNNPVILKLERKFSNESHGIEEVDVFDKEHATDSRPNVTSEPYTDSSLNFTSESYIDPLSNFTSEYFIKPSLNVSSESYILQVSNNSDLINSSNASNELTTQATLSSDYSQTAKSSLKFTTESVIQISSNSELESSTKQSYLTTNKVTTQTVLDSDKEQTTKTLLIIPVSDTSSSSNLVRDGWNASSSTVDSQDVLVPVETHTTENSFSSKAEFVQNPADKLILMRADSNITHDSSIHDTISVDKNSTSATTDASFSPVLNDGLKSDNPIENKSVATAEPFSKDTNGNQQGRGMAGRNIVGIVEPLANSGDNNNESPSSAKANGTPIAEPTVKPDDSIHTNSNKEGDKTLPNAKPRSGNTYLQIKNRDRYKNRRDRTDGLFGRKYALIKIPIKV